MILLCRICLSEIKPNDYINIFSLNSGSEKISEVISNCASIQISENDNLPEGICNFCLDKLNLLYHFKKLIISSDTHLRQAKRDVELEEKISNTDSKTAFMTVKVSKVNDENSTKPNSIFQCDKCNKKFKFFIKKPRNNKPKINSDKIQFKCDKCGEQLTFFLQSPTDGGDFQCAKCSKSFDTNQKLCAHSKVHNPKNKQEQTFMCDQCGKQLKKGFLQRHMQIHQKNDTRNPCPVCGKMVVGFDSHLRTHSATKKYGCSICGKKYFTNHHRKRHEESHKGLKPFTCVICNKSFTKMSSLKLHKRVHTGEKPFTCQFCGQTFAYKQQKLLHEQKHNA